jgi:hypothetical protein
MTIAVCWNDVLLENEHGLISCSAFCFQTFYWAAVREEDYQSMLGPFQRYNLLCRRVIFVPLSEILILCSVVHKSALTMRH